MAPAAFSWNAEGHRLIVQIALDNMDESVRSWYQTYNKALDNSYASQSLVKAAPWLDRIRNQDRFFYLTKYHYINRPYSANRTACLSILDKKNAVTAIEAAKSALVSKELSLKEKGLYLRILLHVVGDLHQPLHAINHCSLRHPKGDMGGGAFILGRNRLAKTLHQYWDKGGGFLCYTRHQVPLKKRALALEHQFPCRSEVSLNPEIWAQESYQIAVQVAYALKEGAVPGLVYQKKVQALTKERIAASGCRLAKLLNSLRVT